ncbi:MAG TPA: fimbrial biogenesis outer membrane usher protein [Novosphingobium sp.]|nr:fimbrial biogenesis outer membrane usher protein [Novosphingobium sp.]
MARGGLHYTGLVGTSALALASASGAHAETAVPAPRLAMSAEQAPIAPAARSQRLNPTGRTIVLTVPAKDGPNYLGDIDLTIGADDALSFPTERLLQLMDKVLAPAVMEALRANLAGKTVTSPAELAAAGLEVTYDPRTLELQVFIPVERRASHSVSVSALDGERIGKVLQPADVSAYLNIRSSVDLVEDGFDTGLASPIVLLDGAVRAKDVVAESDAIWSPGSNGVDFQRLGSRLVYDDTRRLVRITAGDLQTQAQGFQSVPDIAGLSIYRSYSVLSPQQIIRPRGDRTFRLERPATVEILVNGQQVRRLQLGPGNYNLRDFPFAQGANDVRVNILDDAGRSESLRFDVFLDQSQLAKGLSEFGLYAGVKAPLGLRGPSYSNEWMVSGFYRRGLLDFLTLGANVQADKDVQMVGGEAVVSTPLGTLGSHLAWSHVRGLGDGMAVQATFRRQFVRADGQADSLNLFAEHRSKRFAPVTFFLPDNPYKYELGGGYSHSFGPSFYAGVDARFSKGRGANPDVHSYRLSGGWRISPTAALSAETRWQQDSRGREFSALLSLTIRLGTAASLRSEFDTRDNRARVSYQAIHGSGVGSYNVTADVERSDFGSSASMNASYFTNRAELGFSHFGNFTRDFATSTGQRSTFRLGTSLAMADGTVSLGRPIYDSFAIVHPHPSLRKADVIVDPNSFGYAANTGKLGSATMPSLSSYADRTITTDVKNAAPGVDIGQGTFRVFPKYRSGYSLQVGSEYNVTALGQMLDIDGNPVSLVAGRAVELAKPDRAPVTLFTNRQGRFGAAGLAPGRWRLEMLDDKKSTFEITIPAKAEGVVRLGEIKPVEAR